MPSIRAIMATVEAMKENEPTRLDGLDEAEVWYRDSKRTIKPSIPDWLVAAARTAGRTCLMWYGEAVCIA